MKQIYPDVWQAQKGSHAGMILRTYLLTTKAGNTLIYYTNSEEEIAHIKDLGIVKNQYISHHHEIVNALYKNLEEFNSPLVMHKNAQSYLDRSIKKVNIYDKDFVDESNIQIIFTPGHTNNNICLYYQSPYGKSYLFTGDTIYLDKGKFSFLIMRHEGGNEKDLKASLLQLRKLKVDVIMPSVGVGNHDAVEVNEEQWHSIIDNLISEL